MQFDGNELFGLQCLPLRLLVEHVLFQQLWHKLEKRPVLSIQPLFTLDVWWSYVNTFLRQLNENSSSNMDGNMVLLHDHLPQQVGSNLDRKQRKSLIIIGPVGERYIKVVQRIKKRKDYIVEGPHNFESLLNEKKKKDNTSARTSLSNFPCRRTFQLPLRGLLATDVSLDHGQAKSMTPELASTSPKFDALPTGTL
ncbi:hypothetical protein TNCV_2845221 [Trichonephila clavipes]|nr:hypothetical protein TNCV_2845221 [Trichonephila clavipes]